ncbi:MAG: hypothetical protein AAFN38_24780 [Cyanobacteria bacterium J06560_5]
MQLTDQEDVRQLPLSHTIYKDDEINVEKANRLIVYHYPLTKSYRWKEWQTHLDTELSDQYYSYLMRSYRGQFGLFVALDSEDDTPPTIKNSDDVILTPERVSYAPEMNPVWIRLIMRKAMAFGSHSQGSHTLGRPLLKIDVWSGKKSTGINAISLDCRTQQLSDKNTTEIVLFYENVPLRPVDNYSENNEDSKQYRGSFWTYGKNKALVRWIPTHGESPKGTLYKEIKKRKKKRKQRAFLNLSSVKAVKSSWPYILKAVQDELIEQAKKFGFILKPKVLNLIPLPVKTKYKPNPSTRKLIPSMNLDVKVEVLDLRVCKTVSSSEIVEYIQRLLKEKGLGTQLNLLPQVELSDIENFSFEKEQRVLVLLDQLKGVVDDRYPLTRSLHSKVACQHINVNPNDLTGDSVEENILVERSEGEDGDTFLMPEVDSQYYNYDIMQLQKPLCKDALKRNVEIAIKELELKHLLLDEKAKMSTSLPEQSELLTENLVVIVNGHLFTVKDDRPLIIPFNPSVPEHVDHCDNILQPFNTSVRGLLSLLEQRWPYSYKSQTVRQGFGSAKEKLTRFTRRLTIVVHRADGVSIYFQDPKYETPHMIPYKLDEVIEVINCKNKSLPLVKWKLPDKEDVIVDIDGFVEEKVLSESNRNTLLRELDDLYDCWYAALKAAAREGITQISYKKLKKDFSDRFLALKNSKLEKRDTIKSRNSTALVSAWTKLLSQLFNRPLVDERVWLRNNVPGIRRLWHDLDQGYYVVGGLASPKRKILRQPSIRQWHALQGRLDTKLLTALVDVDWVRTNQLAGNPCVATLVNRWQECQDNSVS